MNVKSNGYNILLLNNVLSNLNSVCLSYNSSHRYICSGYSVLSVVWRRAGIHVQ